MLTRYDKYHALGNDFIVIEQKGLSTSKARLARQTVQICNRRTGVGADGVLFLSRHKTADNKIDLYNADGSWAEKSGNGLRIAGVHSFLKEKNKKKKEFSFQTGSTLDVVRLGKKIKGGFMVTVNLGRPEFDTKLVPVKTRLPYMINSPLNIGGVKLPVTCLSVGNPHTVLFVSDFDFDWQALGAEIEFHKTFPNRTNVEFVKVVSRKKVRVADWERGAGATGSSGTGAAASVCAGVIMGLTDRKCEVVFDTGSLLVNWREKSGEIDLTGPVEHVTTGTFDFK